MHHLFLNAAPLHFSSDGPICPFESVYILSVDWYYELILLLLSFVPLFLFSWLLSVVLVVLLHLALLVAALLIVVEAEVPVLPVLLAAGEGTVVP